MTVLVKALLIAPVLRIDDPPGPRSPTVPALCDDGTTQHR